MAKTKTATEQLAALNAAESQERAAARDVQLAAARAEQAHTDARQALVEAHAQGDDKVIARAATALTKAEAEIANFGVRADAAKLRVERAHQAREAFESENADRLIGEIEPEALAARDRLAAAAEELLKAHAAWHETHARVTQIVKANPATTPRDDMPADHNLADVVRQLRVALRDRAEVNAPLPHNRHRRHQEDSQRRNRLVRLGRKPHPTEQEQAEMDELRREVGVTR